MNESPKRGRPPGRFKYFKEETYILLRDIQADTGSNIVHVTNKTIAETLGVCERQASRYIMALVKDGLITTQVRRFEFAPSTYQNVRMVTILGES